MKATIQIDGIEAVMDSDGEWEWISTDKVLEADLNALLDPYGPSGDDPNPPLHAAQYAVRMYGGTLVTFTETPYVKGRVY